MPKPILTQTQIQKLDVATSVKIIKNLTKVDPKILKEKLRKKRSKKYLEAIHKLDIANQTLSDSNKNDLLEIIKEEFNDISLDIIKNNILLGILAKCYLGDDYEVHSLDFVGNIICHYKRKESLPSLFEGARNLCLHSQYEFVEIYETYMVAVSEDGSVSIVSK